MLRSPVILLLALWTSATPLAAAPDSIDVHVTVDSARYEITVTAGPFRPAPMAYEHHDGAHPDLGRDDPVALFGWPVDGWLRGLRLELVDEHGGPLPRELLHHLKFVNFSRRQLVYPLTERLIALGRETGNVSLPITVGMPLRSGAELGIYVMWAVPEDWKRPIFVRAVMRWTPRNLLPRPVSALPLNVDVAFGVGGNTFAVPPGRHERSCEFTLPVSGHLLGASGHLHDHGVGLRLEDVATGRTLVNLRTERDSSGHVTSVRRKLLALWNRGLRLEAGRPYRVVAVYDNRSADTLPAVMGVFAGLFEPDDLRHWPAIDRGDASYRLDLSLLRPTAHAHHEP
jgi:hypothetical protein